ncbi:MAG: hypothetical protein O3C40_37250 [Planctomycetota bacterium]|nr:hypothetical protein [Planctomycetota bacterium]
MDIVCDESDPRFWAIVADICERDPRSIVRLVLVRQLTPRGEVVTFTHRESRGPVGLVVESEIGDERECLITAIFPRKQLLAYARKKMKPTG